MGQLFRIDRRQLLTSLPWKKRQELLVKGWMGHDARWFVTVAEAIGVKRTNPLNQQAARSCGVAEIQRLIRALNMPLPRTVEEYLRLQETGIALYGPDLLDYTVEIEGPDAFRIIVRHCFAHEQVVRAGITEEYECGIFPRLQGWLDAVEIKHELHPPLGRCLKAQGQECTYLFRLNWK